MTKVSAHAGCMAVLMLATWASSASAQTTFTLPGLTLAGPGSSIGVEIRDLSEEASRANPGLEGGVLVGSVRDGSPAARAGFKDGDIVIEFDGERVRSARQFSRIVQETRPDKAVKATVIRGGSRTTLEVTPEAANSRVVSPAAPFARGSNPTLRINPLPDFNSLGQNLRFFAGNRLGADVMDLDGQLAGYFGVKDGVLVTSVATDSAAARAGLRAGDVILEVGGKVVASPRDVTDALAMARPGSALDIKVMRDKKEVTLNATLPGRERPRAITPRTPI
jgi:serine protease Do